jgi:hypothetical protein
MSQINPDHTSTSYLCKIHLNVIHLLRLRIPIGLFLSRFPTNKLYAFLFSIRATCSAHLILIDLTILIIFGEECKL